MKRQPKLVKFTEIVDIYQHVLRLTRIFLSMLGARSPTKPTLDAPKKV